MLSRKKLPSSELLKILFTGFIAVGFLSYSRAGDLTVSANLSAGSPPPEIQASNNAVTQKPLVFFHEKWKHRSLNLFAAYEEPWRDSAVRAKITDGHQEGGCAFIKASFSF
jgi:hypothetical protein